MSVDEGEPTASAGGALALARPLIACRPLLVVSDFDGTISAIANDPWAARIIPSAQRALRALSRVPDVHVALLSGRLVRDLAGRTGIGGVRYVGNFGMERGSLAKRGRSRSMAVELLPVDDSLIALAAQLVSEVPKRVAGAWLVVEAKPAGVAFHFRAAPDLAAAAGAVRAAVDELDPDERLARTAGRRVLELRPHDALGKGDALRELVAEHQPAAIVILGDDVSDAAAFTVLRGMRSTDAIRGLAVAVQARAEVPAAVAEAADVLLASPAEAARFLALLAREVRRARPV